MKKQLAALAIIALIALTCLPVVAADYQDWLDGWNYRTPIRFYNGNGTALIDYQVNFTLNAQQLIMQGKMKSDMTDLVVTDSDALTALPVWVTAAGTSAAKVWVKVPYIPAGVNYTLFAYYGNPLANVVFDSSLVFKRVISSGVVLALPMNEGAGTVCEDYSTNENDGTITGAHWVTSGKFGSGLQFNGNNHYIQLVNDGLGFTNQNFSLIAYINNTNIVNEQYIFDIGTWATKGYRFAIQDSLLKLWSWNPGGATTGTITVGLHTFITTRNGATAKIYQDNIDVTAATANHTTIVATTDNPRIGCYRADGTSASFTDSTINGFFIIQSALSANEIADFNDYYPQCFPTELGKIFLRGWATGCTVVYLTENTTVDTTLEAHTLGWFPSVFLVILMGIGIGLAFLPRIPLINFIYGAACLAITALAVSDTTIAFSPYLQLIFGFVAVLVMASGGLSFMRNH